MEVYVFIMFFHSSSMEAIAHKERKKLQQKEQANKSITKHRL